MKYYLFSIHDSRNINYNSCCQPSNNVNTVLDKILKSATNGYHRILFNNSFMIKSNQDLIYWKNLIHSHIDQTYHSYFIVELSYDNFLKSDGYTQPDFWNWKKLQKKEVESSMCINNFEMEYCK